MADLKIGWIGTGVMGAAMCSHIRKAGYEISVYNRTKEKAKDLIDNGATWCDTPKEVAENSDIVFSIVGFPKDVEEVILGENGILNGCKEGNIIVDMTTSKPSLAADIYNKAKEKNVFSLDAPVTGGDLGAKNAALAIFVGGEKEAYDKVLSILELMGKTIGYMGEAGSGQHSKMANQISIAANICGAVETLVYAKKAGLDLNEIIRIVGSGSAASWQLNNMGPRIVNSDFDPGFYIKHFIKDMGIALEEAKNKDINLPSLELVHSLYKKAEGQGYENLGTQALYKLFDV